MGGHRPGCTANCLVVLPLRALQNTGKGVMSAPGCVTINRKQAIYQAAIQLLIQKRNKQGNIGLGRMFDIEHAVDEAVEIYGLVTKHPAMNTPGFGLPPAPEPAGRISLKNKRKPKNKRKMKKLPTPPQPKFGKLKKIE